MNFDADVRTFLPQRAGTNALALRIIELALEFNLGSRPSMGGQSARGTSRAKKRRGGMESSLLAAGIVNQSADARLSD
jgi:hypothetical protein